MNSHAGQGESSDDNDSEEDSEDSDANSVTNFKLSTTEAGRTVADVIGQANKQLSHAKVNNKTRNPVFCF